MVTEFWAGIAIGALVIILVVLYVAWRVLKALWNVL